MIALRRSFAAAIDGCFKEFSIITVLKNRKYTVP